jgi:hypothetical protein
MNELEIIEQFRASLRSAKTYRETAFVLLIVGAIALALYGVYRARIELWGGILLAAGIVLLVVSFALAMLSFLKLRCPNCSRILGEVSGTAFCPACGVPLKRDGSAGMETAAGKKARWGTAGKQAGARRTALSRWEPRAGQLELVEYPEEAYPKNIRMFTTRDETELTKRYLHLIHRDDSQPGTSGGFLSPEAARGIAPKARPSAAKPKAEKPAQPPNWRKAEPVAVEEEAEGFLSRPANKIRRG